jgi:site-specific DNA-methyltransferase (adenine-specific)
MVYLADCMDLMKLIPPDSVDVVFADPPYRLSTGGVTVKSGMLATVDKGAWDRSMGFAGDHRFNVRWLKEASRILKPDGTPPSSPVPPSCSPPHHERLVRRG